MIRSEGIPGGAKQELYVRYRLDVARRSLERRRRDGREIPPLDSLGLNTLKVGRMNRAIDQLEVSANGIHHLEQ